MNHILPPPPPSLSLKSLSSPSNSTIVCLAPVYSTSFTTFPMAIVLPSSRSVKRPIGGKSLNVSRQNASVDSSRMMHLSSWRTNFTTFFSRVSLSIVQMMR